MNTPPGSAARPGSSTSGGTQGAADLHGRWSLVEAYAIDAAGKRLHDAYGTEPNGMLHYGEDGRMMALVTHGGRAPLDGDRLAAPAEQRAEAFRSTFAYAGRYRTDGDRVVHEVEMSTYPNWVGTALVRTLAFEDGAAVLTTPPQMQNGRMTVYRLVWRRAD